MSNGRKGLDHNSGWVSGFTLLELIIALALLALMVTIVLGAMRMGLRSLESGERKTERLERFRTVSNILDAQIQSQLPITQENEGKKSYYFRGSNKTLKMITGHSLWGGRRGVVMVDYSVQMESGGKETLWVTEQIPGVEGKREIRLFPPVSKLSFDYFARKHADLNAQGDWVDQWEEETVIPEAIRVHIEDGDTTNLLVFPLRARGEITQGSLMPLPVTGGNIR